MSINDVYIGITKAHVTPNKCNIQLGFGALYMTFKIPIKSKDIKHNKSLLHKQYQGSNMFPIREAPQELLDMFYKSVEEETITALVQLTLRHSDVRYRELCRYALNLIEEGLK